MLKSTNLRRGRTCVFLLHAHLVFVTKYRRVVFVPKILLELKDIFDSVCANFGCRLVEFDGKDDHVHLPVNYPPKIAISSLVNSLKGVSSRLIRKKIIPPFATRYGETAYGRQVISQEVAEELR